MIDPAQFLVPTRERCEVVFGRVHKALPLSKPRFVKYAIPFSHQGSGLFIF